MILTQDELLRKAVDHYGLPNQLRMTQEECAELIVAISHHIRGREGGGINLLEEIADVQIMLDQIKIGLGEVVQRDIWLITQSKRHRLQKRLGIAFEDNGRMFPPRR